MSEDDLLYAMHNYENPGCRTTEEFESDFQKFLLVSRLLKKDVVNVKLVLNHIITLYNVFKHEACTKILFKKVDRENWHRLKPFVLYLNYMPESILLTYSSNIALCQKIINELREI